MIVTVVEEEAERAVRGHRRAVRAQVVLAAMLVILKFLQNDNLCALTVVSKSITWPFVEGEVQSGGAALTTTKRIP